MNRCGGDVAGLLKEFAFAKKRCGAKSKVTERRGGIFFEWFKGNYHGPNLPTLKFIYY